MSDRVDDPFAASQARVIQMTGVVLFVLSVVTGGCSGAAYSQTNLQIAPRQQGVPPETTTVPEPPRERPGLIDEIGKLLKDSTPSLPSLPALPSPGQTFDNLNSGARGAADSLKQVAPLSAQTVVSGRSLCPVASNGAPDCNAGANQLCAEKGYREGKSVDIESTQKCSAKAYFSGQGACRTENFVTKAVCQ